RHALDELTRLPVLLAIGDKVVFQLDLAAMRSAPQGQPGAQYDKWRRRIANRRAIGDIATKGAHIADLLAGYPVPELCYAREILGQYRQRFRITHPGIEPHFTRIVGDSLELLQVIDENHRPDRAHELGDP